VKLLDIDAKTGKFRLSHRVLLEKPEGYEERQALRRERRSQRGERGERGERRERRGPQGEGRHGHGDRFEHKAEEGSQE
jgi:polyribonucleotide nucleotidyltransferase